MKDKYNLSMDINDLNKNFFEQFMDKLASENKEIYLMGDFNIDFHDYYNDLL